MHCSDNAPQLRIDGFQLVDSGAFPIPEHIVVFARALLSTILALLFSHIYLYSYQDSNQTKDEADSLPKPRFLFKLNKRRVRRRIFITNSSLEVIEETEEEHYTDIEMKRPQSARKSIPSEELFLSPSTCRNLNSSSDSNFRYVDHCPPTESPINMSISPNNNLLHSFDDRFTLEEKPRQSSVDSAFNLPLRRCLGTVNNSSFQASRSTTSLASSVSSGLMAAKSIGSLTDLVFDVNPVVNGLKPRQLSDEELRAEAASKKLSTPEWFRKSEANTRVQNNVRYLKHTSYEDIRKSAQSHQNDYLKPSPSTKECTFPYLRKANAGETPKLIVDVANSTRAPDKKCFVDLENDFDSKKSVQQAEILDSTLAECYAPGLSTSELFPATDFADIGGLTREQILNHKDFIVSNEDGIGPEVKMVRCRYKPCAKIRELGKARATYKTCHQCYTYYCSRKCRADHFNRHTYKCRLSEVGRKAKYVLNTIRSKPALWKEASAAAEFGFYSHGKGVLLTFFKDLAALNAFLSEPQIPELRYVSELDLDDCFTLYAEGITPIIETCDFYKRFVLVVGVGISDLKKNSKVEYRVKGDFMFKWNKYSYHAKGVDEDDIKIDFENTMILTASSTSTSFEHKKNRELCFSNIQRALRSRGIDARRHFPDVYKKLCDFVETGEKFEPITIYPLDKETNRKFMCVIMPDSELNFLEWLDDSSIQYLVKANSFETTI